MPDTTSSGSTRRVLNSLRFLPLCLQRSRSARTARRDSGSEARWSRASSASSFKPGARATQTKAVAPAIHIGEQATTGVAWNGVRQQALQIADSGFLQIRAAAIGMQCRPPFRRHAQQVTGGMQDGVHRGVAAGVDAVGDDSSFRARPNSWPGWARLLQEAAAEYPGVAAGRPDPLQTGRQDGSLGAFSRWSRRDRGVILPECPRGQCTHNNREENP